MNEAEETSIPPSYRVFHQGRLVRGGGLTTASVKRYAPEQPRTVRYHKQIKIRGIPNWTPPKAQLRGRIT